MSDVEFRRFKKLLKTNGHFVTAPRMRLFGHLQKRPTLTMKRLISLVDIHDQATIYRNIDLFEKLGIINRLRLGWETKIELSDMFRHHHHHFSCVKCGRVIALADDVVLEKRIASLGRNERFHALDHQLEIRGLCTSCQTK